MKVQELSKDELMELKQRYAMNKLGIFCFENVADEMITDEEIYNEYEDYYFVEDDFFCNQK